MLYSSNIKFAMIEPRAMGFGNIKEQNYCFLSIFYAFLLVYYIANNIIASLYVLNEKYMSCVVDKAYKVCH